MGDSTWEAHKGDIERLYMREGKTLDEVKDILEATRGFRGSKKQYERAFTKWRFKKYKMTPQRWKYINVKLQKRKRESDIFVYGERYPPEKVRRGISRHGHVSTVELFSTPSIETLEGIVVCTPEPSGSATLEWPRKLPWLQFLRLTGTESKPGHAPCVSSRGLFVLAGSLEKQIPIPDLIGKISSTLVRANIRNGLNIVDLANCLRVIMPEEYEGQHFVASEALLRGGHPVGQQECLKLMLYLLSNNIPLRVDIEDERPNLEDDFIMQLFRGLRLNTLENMRTLLALASVTAGAAAERLFGSALRTKDLTSVEMLLNSGLDPHTPVLDEEWCPLMPLEYVASSRVSHQMTRLLLLYHADPNKSLGQFSALQMAILKKDKALMEILLHAGAEICSRTLEIPVMRSDVSVVEMLLDTAAIFNKTIQLNTKNYGALLGIAVRSKNMDMTKLLLSWGADVNALQVARGPENQTTSLGIAAYAGDIPLMELLLAHGAVANPELPGGLSYFSPLALAVENNRTEAVRLLLCRGGDVNAVHRLSLGKKKHQTNVLGLAAVRGNLDIIELLLAADPVVNPHFPDGDLHAYPLGIAVYYRHESAARCLLAAGAVPNDPTAIWVLCDAQERLCTVFEYSLSQGQLGICSNLLNAGATVTGRLLQDYYSASLQRSIRRQDFDTIIQLLQCDIQLDHAYGSFGHAPGTPLGAATETGNIELIDGLRYAGTTNFGPALARIGNVESAKYLATAGVLHGILRRVGGRIIPNALFKNDEKLACYLLEWAVEQQSEDIIDLMLRGKGERVDPLELAIGAKKLKMAKTLIAHGAAVTQYALEEAVYWAVMGWDNEILRDLVSQISPGEFRAPVGVGLAVGHGNLPLVKILLDAGIDPRGFPVSATRPWLTYHGSSESEFRSVLELAAMEGHFHILKVLLESVSWSARDMGQALARCVRHWEYTIMQDLFRRGADVNQTIRIDRKKQTPLDIAVAREDHLMIRTLIETGSNPSKLPSEQNSPPNIQDAVETGNLEIVDMVLEAGADINSPPGSVRNATAIQLAAKKGNIDLVNNLLERGADVNNPPAPKKGATALQFAAMKGLIGLARRLIEVGANVNAGRAREHGRTALEGAAEHGRIDMVQFLLENGALVEGRGRGQLIRAVMLAERNAHITVSKLLKSYGHWTESDAERCEQEINEYDELKENHWEEDCDNDLVDMTYNDM